MTSNRVLAADVRTVALNPDDPAIVSGPRTSSRALAAHGDTEVGVWELTAGTVTDTEVDEVFVVLAGDGTVTFADGSAIELRPGVAVRLQVGDRTTWTVRETLRKIYVI